MANSLPEAPVAPQVPGEGVHPVREVLPGLETLDVFPAICGSLDPDVLLAEAHVVCFQGDGYPRVDDHTGHILCPDRYTQTHDDMIVYLDLVHELVHVRQVLEGKEVYHFPDPYVTWPTEIEAYRISYEEAKRLGVEDAWFWEYLAVPWVEDDELAELADAIGLPIKDVLEPETPEKEGARH